MKDNSNTQNTGNTKSKTNLNTNTYGIIGKISDEVFNLVVSGNNIDFSSSDLSNLEEKILNLFNEILSSASFSSIMNDYYIGLNKGDKELNDIKISNKIDKNFLIYLPFLIKKINKDCENIKENLIPNEILLKRIIKVNILKFLKIIYIFGDKIDIKSLNKLLELNNSELKNAEMFFKEKTKSLDENENELIKNLFKGGKDKEFKSGVYLSSIFQVSVRKAFAKLITFKTETKEEKTKKFRELLAESIEKEIKVNLEQLFILFKKTINNKGSSHDDLQLIKDGTHKILGYIQILKDNNLAYTEINFICGEAGFEDHILNRIFSNFDNNKAEDKAYLTLLLDNTNGLTTTYKIFSDTADSRKNIKDTNKKRNNEYIEWNKKSSSQIYQRFIKEVIETKHDGNIKLTKELKLGNKKVLKSLLETFCELYSLDKIKLYAQIEKIKTIIKKGKSLEDFIGNDINNLQFLYNFWMFILKTGKNQKVKKISYYKKFNKESLGLVKLFKEGFLKDNEDKIKSLNKELEQTTDENQYEVILAKIKKLEELNDFDFNLNSTTSNFSAYNVETCIDSTFSDLKSGILELDDYLVGGRLLKEEIELYTLGNDYNQIHINSYLDIGINTCLQVLQGSNKINSTSERKYYDLLISKEIIPKDGDITDTHLNEITKLLNGLKHIKSKTSHLGEMLKTADDDFFKVYGIFSGMIEKNINYNKKTADGMGPSKNFGRAFTKLIQKYNGDLHQLQDLTRLRFTREGISELSDAFSEILENISSNDVIKSFAISDWSGHPLSISKKKSGYRDVNINLTLDSGNTVELQLHFSGMLRAKSEGRFLGEEIKEKLEEESCLNSKEIEEIKGKIKSRLQRVKKGNKITNKALKQIEKHDLEKLEEMKKENCLLNIDELKKFIVKFYKINGPIDIKTLKILSGINNEDVFKSINAKYILYNNNGSNNRKLLSCDTIYNIRRDDKTDIIFTNKLTRLERILFDEEWGRIITKYLKEEIIKK